MRKMIRLSRQRQSVLMSILLGVTFVNGCLRTRSGLSARTRAQGHNDIQVELCASCTNETSRAFPDFLLTIYNHGRENLYLYEYDGIFRGELIIHCGEDVFTLRHRKVWIDILTITFGSPPF